MGKNRSRAWQAAAGKTPLLKRSSKESTRKRNKLLEHVAPVKGIPNIL